VLKVGIAGCGLIAGSPIREGRPIATNHAAACRATGGCELVAAADPDADRRAAFSKQWGVAAIYPTVDAMLRSHGLDVLVVATPADTHEAVCTAGIAAGVRGVLCEKPLSGHAEGARRIVERCQASGVHLAVNFTRRWDATHQELAARVGAGAIGTLRGVSGLYTGTLRGNGSHLVDTVNMLTRRSDWTVGWTNRVDGKDDGAIAATLFAEDLVFHIMPIDGAEYFVFEIQLVGTRGRARMLLGGNDVRIDHPRSSEQYPGYSYLLHEERLGQDTLTGAFVNIHRSLAAAVRGESSLPFSAAEHIATLEGVDELVRAATDAEEEK
jgi:predicted dehydrogenase